MRLVIELYFFVYNRYMSVFIIPNSLRLHYYAYFHYTFLHIANIYC